jgi:hypothetical protein
MYTRGLARSYTGLADAYTLGAQHASSREAAADARRQARDTYRKGLELWIALRAHHELWTREAARPEDVAKRLAALGDSN